LHHAGLGIGEVMDAVHEKVGWRHEVGVKDGDELALGGFKPSAKAPAL